MTKGELAELARLLAGNGKRSKAQTHDAAAALSWAEEHLFDRRSVVNDHELWRHALEFARGSEMKIAALKSLAAKRDYLRDENQPRKLTTREVVMNEPGGDLTRILFHRETRDVKILPGAFDQAKPLDVQEIKKSVGEGK